MIQKCYCKPNQHPQPATNSPNNSWAWPNSAPAFLAELFAMVGVKNWCLLLENEFWFESAIADGWGWGHVSSMLNRHLLDIRTTSAFHRSISLTSAWRRTYVSLILPSSALTPASVGGFAGISSNFSNHHPPVHHPATLSFRKSTD